MALNDYDVADEAFPSFFRAPRQGARLMLELSAVGSKCRRSKSQHQQVVDGSRCSGALVSLVTQKTDAAEESVASLSTKPSRWNNIMLQLGRG